MVQFDIIAQYLIISYLADTAGHHGKDVLTVGQEIRTVMELALSGKRVIAVPIMAGYNQVHEGRGEQRILRCRHFQGVSNCRRGYGSAGHGRRFTENR